MRKLFILCLYLFLNKFVQNIKLPNNVPQRRVTNGIKPPSLTYPYTSQVRLHVINKDKKNFLCSGTIITRKAVLTAAHCIIDKIKITIGYSSFTVDGLTLVEGKRWFVHPLYESKKLDIGLVGTKSIMKLTVVPDYGEKPTSFIEAAFPNRWITRSSFLVRFEGPSLMCGWGRSESDGLNCLNFPKLDQNCLKARDDNSFSWCFYYPLVPGGSNNTYSNPCFGDSGAGIFPDLKNVKWRLFAVTSNIRKNNCEGDSHAIGIQITPNISDWIIGKLKLIHGNDCALKAEY